MFGLEAIFRNGVPVGHLRRADYGFFIDKTIGYGYIRNPDGGVVKNSRTCQLTANSTS